MQQDFFRRLQQQHMQPQDVHNNMQNWSFQQQQHPSTSVITSASRSTTAPAASVASSRSSSKCKQSAYGDNTSGASAEKMWKSEGAPGAVAVVGLRQSLDIFNDSFTQSMAANTNATSQKYEMEAATIKTQDNTVMLVQQQETDLTNNQIVVLIDLFPTTYLNIQREDLRKTWLAAQLKRAFEHLYNGFHLQYFVFVDFIYTHVWYYVLCCSNMKLASICLSETKQV
jgi:hypothetical protein